MTREMTHYLLDNVVSPLVGVANGHKARGYNRN
jgi:hypothetical protein